MREVAGGNAKYEVFGPLQFRLEGSSSFDDALDELFTKRKEGLENAVGAYVWTRNEGGAKIPWNVGMTSRQGFKTRFGQKAKTIAQLLADSETNVAEVYLLALCNKKGGFRKPTKSEKGIPANDWLETMLIASAIRVNPELRNVARSKYLRNAVVEGYLNDDEEKRTPAARSFNEVFQTRKRK